METNNTLTPNTLLRGKSYTYTIQKVLGQGTFGITYLATTNVKIAGGLGELETTMQVAVKEFFMKEVNGRKDNAVTTGSQGGIYANYKKKFAREAENLSKLHHSNIVKVLEFFEANNTVYYAMEYLEGGSLDNYIKQQNGLPEAECVKYTRQIGSALSYMHAHKMLHLDLKPGNVMLRKNGDAVLIDFGLSKQYDENGEPESSTSVGGGTPGYAPLEQANYHEGKDFPVTMDVYALGATMYKMLTGVRPPEASVILNKGFPAYELQEHHVSDTLIACIAQAMSPIEKKRPRNVNALLYSMETGKVDDDTMFDDKEKEKTENSQPGKKRKRNQYIIWSAAIVGIIIGFFVYKNATEAPIKSKSELLEWAVNNQNEEMLLTLVHDSAYVQACYPLAQLYFDRGNDKQALKYAEMVPVSDTNYPNARHIIETVVGNEISGLNAQLEGMIKGLPSNPEQRLSSLIEADSLQQTIQQIAKSKGIKYIPNLRILQLKNEDFNYWDNKGDTTSMPPVRIGSYKNALRLKPDNKDIQNKLDSYFNEWVKAGDANPIASVKINCYETALSIREDRNVRNKLAAIKSSNK